MEKPNISHDDLLDVKEMIVKIENSIFEILEGESKPLAISALMSASINCLMGQCSTRNEVLFYKELFIKVLNNCVESIKIVEKEKELL